MLEIMKLAQEHESYMIEVRRHLHTHPEVSNKELETIEYISGQLKEIGVEHVVVPDGGILGFIDGPTPGKTVLLRADCDALPMQEAPENLKGPRVCISTKDGAMHACGHDGHVAMLLAAAKILQANKDQIKGRVVLLFERGEEGTGNLVYLYKYIQDNGIKIDGAYGTHLYSELESGKIAVNPSNVMAGALGFKLVIRGRGGHGSRPDQSISPIDCFAALYIAICNIRMKKIGPFSPLTFSVGYVHAGTQGNIIPDALEFGGSVRLYSMEDGVMFRETLRSLMKSVGDSYDCEVTGTLTGPGLPVINDAQCAAMAKEAIGGAIGAERVVETEPWMGSESMSTILTMWPGVFALLGIKNEEVGSGAAHHNEFFDIDEGVLKLGAAGAVAYALGFLESDIDTEPRKWKKSIADMYRYANRAGAMVDFLEGREPSAYIGGKK